MSIMFRDIPPSSIHAPDSLANAIMFADVHRNGGSMRDVTTDWMTKAEQLTYDVRNFVDGRRQDAQGGERIEKYAPRDGRLLCRFGVSQGSDIEKAVASARQAFE